ncbi:MAG: DUF2520 domain-containing protein [Rhizobiaceae bacterium]|nr:DUF2520 domain-containing protein [Rhizobiaceae bacterium]
MRNISINFIGAGNLGKTIAHLIRRHETATIQGICNSTLESSQKAIQFIGEGAAFSKITDLPPCDITFITTADDNIQQCCEILSTSNLLKPGSIVLHCSGSLSSEILSSSKVKGCFTASAHPMRSFANPAVSINQYKGTYCAIEGDTDAISTVRTLFTKIGSTTFEIERTKKSIYHTAGVFASNYLVAIAERSQNCLEQAGVEKELAIRITLNLMQGTLKNLEFTLSPEDSLTGPIKRGDKETVKKHLRAISDKRLSTLYRSLGLATLNVANLPNEKAKEIESLLTSEEEPQPILHAKL